MENTEKNFEKEKAREILDWFDGPQDYQTGKDLLKSIPDGHLQWLQLSDRGDLMDTTRLVKTFKNLLKYWDVSPQTVQKESE